MSDKETDWKKIALALAQRVNFAMQHCKSSGALMDMNSNKLTTWREYFADGMEMIPGVKVDREIMETLELPPSRRKKAQQEIREKRKNEAAASEAAA